jgi:predicted acyltransferase
MGIMTTVANPAAVQPARDAAGATAAGTARLMSLDALRGFDMIWIIGAERLIRAWGEASDLPAVDYLATQLKHVTWEGFRFYDLIFPLFLFIIGVTTVFSLDGALARGGRAGLLLRVLRRSALLFLLGVFRDGGLSSAWPDVALAGVLQRIAACYLLTAVVYCLVRSELGLIAVAAALLAGYWALLTFVPFPDINLRDVDAVKALGEAIGSQAPRDIAAAVSTQIRGVYEEGRNLTNYFDFLYLPGRKSQTYYINEGLLSTLPSLALPLLGAVAGKWLKDDRLAASRKLARLVVLGLVCVGLGLAWSYQFPLIKRIWTSSFVLAAAGASALLLALFYLVVDVWQRRTWCRPFVWIGSNAITLYILAAIVDFQAIARRLVGGSVGAWIDVRFGDKYAQVAVAAVALVLIVALARLLYRYKIFLRL